MPDAFERIKDIEVVVLAKQLARDVLPRVDAAGVQAYLCAIGSQQSGVEFAAATGFPPDRLIADPNNAAYDALEFNRGFKATFLTKETGVAVKARMDRDGAADLKDLAKDYKIFKPPQGLQQTLIQGGCLIFHGRTPVLVRLDKGTADHVDFEEAIAIASN